jgi:hypothetical protein
LIADLGYCSYHSRYPAIPPSLSFLSFPLSRHSYRPYPSPPTPTHSRLPFPPRARAGAHGLVARDACWCSVLVARGLCCSCSCSCAVLGARSCSVLGAWCSVLCLWLGALCSCSCFVLALGARGSWLVLLFWLVSPCGCASFVLMLCARAAVACGLARAVAPCSCCCACFVLVVGAHGSFSVLCARCGHSCSSWCSVLVAPSPCSVLVAGARGSMARGSGLLLLVGSLVLLLLLVVCALCSVRGSLCPVLVLLLVLLLCALYCCSRSWSVVCARGRAPCSVPHARGWCSCSCSCSCSWLVLADSWLERSTPPSYESPPHSIPPELRTAATSSSPSTSHTPSHSHSHAVAHGHRKWQEKAFLTDAKGSVRAVEFVPAEFGLKLVSSFFLLKEEEGEMKRSWGRWDEGSWELVGRLVEVWLAGWLGGLSG